MASQGFVLRLRTPSGMKRLAFKSDKDTFQTLQQVVQAETKIAPNEQMLSTTPLVSPNFLNAAPSTTLAALKLKHGDILHIVDTTAPAPTKPTSSSTPSSSQPSSQPSQPTSTVKLTRDCKHGPNGRCIHCDGAPIVSSALKTRMPCSHGSNATCPNCSEYVNSSENKDQLPTWLCNHPESAFCPMCIPKDDDEKGVRGLKCSCNKSKGQQCLNCIETKPAMKVDLVPYAQYMKERRALCKFSHQPTVICASCAPPRMEDYKGKRNCDRGHKPWPYAVCLNCAPPNANPRLQHYRHCDTVSFEDLNSIKTFYQDWMRRGPENQRAGILFGVYTDEPETSNLEGGIRAQVQAIYEPPQESNLKGVRFLKDPHEQAVHRVAGLLGLQPVGWIITTIPRSGPKYGGKVFLSGSEIKQAARFQNRYKNELGFSRFVTVVVEHAQHVAPDAYQVSDQCVALERDGVLAPAQDPFMLTTHVPAQGEIVPTFIWKGKRLEPGKEFLPDEFIVKLIISASGQPRPMFRFTEFRISGGEQELKTYLLRHAREEYHVKLSDFNLLCFLPSVLSMPLAEQVCAALVTGERFPNELKGALDRAFAAKKLI